MAHKLFHCSIVSLLEKCVKKNKNNKGFTLIELLVVIGIIGILAGIVIIAANPVENLAKARDSRKKGSISQIGRAIISYKTVNNGTFPPDSTWDSELLLKNEITILPENPSDEAGCNTNLKPGPDTGWCYETYTDTATGNVHALLYAKLDAIRDQSKCDINSGELAFYVWASINGGSGVYCTNIANMANSFNDHKNFVGD